MALLSSEPAPYAGSAWQPVCCWQCSAFFNHLLVPPLDNQRIRCQNESASFIKLSTDLETDLMFRHAVALITLLLILVVLPSWAEDKPPFAGPTDKGFL